MGFLPKGYDAYVQGLRAAVPDRAWDQDWGRFNAFYAQPLTQGLALGTLAGGAYNIANGDGDDISSEMTGLLGAGIAASQIALKREMQYADKDPAWVSKNILTDPILNEEALKRSTAQKVWDMVTGRTTRYNPIDLPGNSPQAAPAAGGNPGPAGGSSGGGTPPVTGGGNTPTTTGSSPDMGGAPRQTNLEQQAQQGAANNAAAAASASGTPATPATPIATDAGTGTDAAPRGRAKTLTREEWEARNPDKVLRKRATDSAASRVTQTSQQSNPQASTVEASMKQGTPIVNAADDAGVGAQVADGKAITQARQMVADTARSIASNQLIDLLTRAAEMDMSSAAGQNLLANLSSEATRNQQLTNVMTMQPNKATLQDIGEFIGSPLGKSMKRDAMVGTLVNNLSTAIGNMGGIEVRSVGGNALAQQLNQMNGVDAEVSRMFEQAPQAAPELEAQSPGLKPDDLVRVGRRQPQQAAVSTPQAPAQSGKRMVQVPRRVR